MASSAAAGTLQAPAVDPASRITLTLRTPFDDAGPPGACTIEMTIHNGSTRPGVWDVTIDTRSGFASSQASRYSLAVEAGATRTFVLVGLATTMNYWGASTVSMRGPGVSSLPVAGCPHEWRGPPAGSGVLTAPFAMSRAVAGGVWDALEQKLAADSHTMLAGRFTAAELPAEPRSYAGLALLYLRQDEWAALPANVKEAIQDWVALGGTLWLLGPPASETRVGFGRVSTRPLVDGGKVDWVAIAEQAAAAPASEFDRGRYDAYEPWTLPGQLAPSEPQRGLLFGYLAAVALLIGPLNLFWFARGRLRHRVYWTTPLLSAAAALALGALIVLKDGTGGEGLRFTVVAIRPDVHRASVVQEQVARTGLLLASVFRSAETLRVVPLNLNSNPMATMSPSRMETAADVHSGWFRSRSLDAQYLETTRPTRGRVEVTRGSAPVEAVSSLEGVLEDLYVRDEQDVVWHASGVRAGERVPLTRAKDTDLATWFVGTVKGAGPAAARRLQGVTTARAYFYATATGGPAVATLPAIRWKQERFVYVGPVERLP